MLAVMRLRDALTLWVAAALLAAALACGSNEQASEPAGEPQTQVYDLRGEVVRVSPEEGLAVIRHEDIPGWMKAMTMDFPIKDREALEKLKPGMRIEAKVHVRDLDFWLSDIRILGEAGPPGQ